MSESSESLCKLISNILGINWAINQWYMCYFVHLAGAGLCVCVCVCEQAYAPKMCTLRNYSVHMFFIL